MALMRGSQSTAGNVADQASRRTARSLTTAPEGAKRPGTVGPGSGAFDRVGQRMQCRPDPGGDQCGPDPVPLLGWWWSAGKPGRQLTSSTRSGVHGGSCGGTRRQRSRCQAG
jgi:hypothetical protein